VVAFDHADLQVLDQQSDVGSPEADVVQPADTAEGDYADGVDAVVAVPVVGGCGVAATSTTRRLHDDSKITRRARDTADHGCGPDHRVANVLKHDTAGGAPSDHVREWQQSDVLLDDLRTMRGVVSQIPD
jgi:hypothetical protein